MTLRLPAAAAAAAATLVLLATTANHPAHAKLADRSRVVKRRLETGRISSYHDNGRPLEGPKYRSAHLEDVQDQYVIREQESKKGARKEEQQRKAPWQLDEPPSPSDGSLAGSSAAEGSERKLSSQLSGCCYNYQKYSAQSMCALYGNDCESGETKSHDSGDGSCTQEGLSFIGLSFSVNTASGNPYSYQLCDQFPMENIIDRDYKYLMSMDEDGWLVGGGYKTFDYSGKMPYVHDELRMDRYVNCPTRSQFMLLCCFRS
jgi:hypothetical protein